MPKRKNTRNDYKPFFSILFIVLTMFVMVFFKMETRRLGYQAVKLNSRYLALQDELRLQTIHLAKVVRPDRVRSYAVSHLTLSEARKGQIIQMAGSKIALTH